MFEIDIEQCPQCAGAFNAGADIVKMQADDGLEMYHKPFAGYAKNLGMKTALTVRSAGPYPDWPDYLKVGSGECLNTAIIEAVKADGRPWIISTGGTTVEQYIRIRDHGPTIICECTSAYPSELARYG